MSFNQNDGFGDEFKIWLRKITQLLIDENAPEKEILLNENRYNRLMACIHNNQSPQSVRLDDFVKQTFVALRDEFSGVITYENYNCLRIQLSDNDIFRLQIVESSDEGLLW